MTKAEICEIARKSKHPKYLTQRDNIDLEGKASPSNQCFIASVCMFLQWVIVTFRPDKAKEVPDERAYLAIVMSSLRKAETRFDWSVHQRIINKILVGLDVGFTVVSTPASIESVSVQLEMGYPTVLSMWGQQFKPSVKGHIWLAWRVSYDEKGQVSFRGHDPYGNAETGWKDHNGSGVTYSEVDLKKMFTNSRRYFQIKIK